jgi:hypothetical protein
MQAGAWRSARWGVAFGPVGSGVRAVWGRGVGRWGWGSGDGYDRDPGITGRWAVRRPSARSQ